MRGRKPKPTHLKMLEGSRKDRINRSEPKPRPIRPTCPKWLSPAARKHWLRLAPELELAGLLTVVDGPALAGLCSALALAQQAETKPAIGPWHTVRFKSWQQIRQFAIEFGLTPSSRSRLSLTAPIDEEDLERMID